jgi:electron transport complex protein RnfC
MEPKNLMVPIGTSFDLLSQAAGRKSNPYKILSGGPMMGAAQFDVSVPVIKGTNAITILGEQNRFYVEAAQCIRCGKCIDACPMKLMPVLMYKAMLSGNLEEIKAANIMDCIECGCCAYTCPASVPLVHGFRTAKLAIRQAAAAAKK